MQVKKYQGRSIPEAVSLVKRELGPDALILSTKKLGSGTRGSTYKDKGLFEISAVVGDIHEDSRSSNFDPDWLSAVKSELMSIKDMILLLSRCGHLMEGFRANPGAIDLYAKLIRSGIAEPHAQWFLKKAGGFEEDAQVSSNNALKRVIEQISRVIDVTDPFRETQRQVLAAFIGPTGVGKTTTIAKLAADLSLRQKKTVGLISIDSYRIAAIEQLKTYASILGVPCFAADSPSNLEFALRRMKDRDVILIDTAGQSHYDTARMKEMKKLIGSDKSINSHLLLSTVTNELEMDKAARNFSPLRFNSYIFTKTDETMARGVIINQVLKLKMPVSFITTGQSVPEDIIKATKTGVLRLIFQRENS